MKVYSQKVNYMQVVIVRSIGKWGFLQSGS